MKVGDTVPVYIAGHVVAQARVEAMGDGTATLIVPATRAIMGVRTDLTDLPEKEESGTDHQILGVERDGETVDVEPPAPVGEQPPSTNNEQSTESVGDATQSVDPPELNSNE